jgi:Flp pilus assembly protein CpaB
MKTHRLITVCATLAVLVAAGVLAGPVLRAADKSPAPAGEKKETAAEKKVRLAQEELAQYDKNKNGKLDPEELAAEKADKNKAAAEKRKATIQKKKEDAAAPSAETKK